MDIKHRKFGVLPGGEEIFSYQLENDKGTIARIINYGGIITHLFTPDSKGNTGDIVLGFDTLEEYLGPHPYFGAIIGRYANRISGGHFSLENKPYKLAVNNGPNHLHGGLKGFDKRTWKAYENLTDEYASLKLTYESPDGEEDYPGNLLVEVEYRLNNENELVIKYMAESDRTTHVNLTNHSYFNLNTSSADVYDHMLQIDSEYITEIDKVQIPTGNLSPVNETAFDFRQAKKIGRDIHKVEPGYDHNYVVRQNTGHLRKFARVQDPDSGRVMEVLTTQPGVQLYTANYVDGIKGKEGRVYNKHSAFCLETQHFPDSPNKPKFPSTVLKPGETYNQTTVYRFGTINQDLNEK